MKGKSGFLGIIAITMVLSVSNDMVAQTNSSTIQSPYQIVYRSNDSADGQVTDGVYGFKGDETYSLPWKPIKEEDILWGKRVFREISVSEKGNEALQYDAGNKVSDLYINIIAAGVFSGDYKAYSAANDRFTDTISKETLREIIANANTGNGQLDNGRITSLLTKEDWLYLEKEHKMVCRIVGVAPAKVVVNADGSKTTQPLFWLYYPEMRKYMSEQIVFQSGQAIGVNWDEYFEKRMFKSKIQKVTDRGLSKKSTRKSTSEDMK